MTNDTIKFSAPYDSAFTMETARLRWKLRSHSFRKWHFITGGVAVVLLASSLAFRGQPLGGTLTQIGILGAAALIVQLMLRASAKDRYMKLMKQICERAEKEQLVCSYAISPEIFGYADQEQKVSLQWSVFKAYSLYQDHLVIWQSASVLTAHFFKAGEEGLSETDYERFVQLAETKLPFKAV